MPFEYYATIKDVTDGDTLRVELDLGFRLKLDIHVRLLGMNAPEMNTPEGVVAKAFMESLVAGKDVVLVKTEKAPDQKRTKQKFDKYDRWCAHVYLNLFDPEAKSLSEMMVEAGHAVRKAYKLASPKFTRG